LIEYKSQTASSEKASVDTNLKSILIVEDDLILAMVLERMVLKLNYSVVDKEVSGKGDIEMVENHHPDLILMDIQLEDNINGIEAMRRIRRNSDVPVIYITGNSDQYYIDRARETNYIDYLIKPIQMSDLEGSINKVFTES
jgi:CheY-like chemotaxis protein